MPAAKEIDLRDITALVVIPQQGGVSLRLDEVTLTNRPTTPGQPERQSGFWVWDYREAAARGSSLLDDCRSVRCSRLAVQMPALDEPEQVWLRYVALLQAAQEQGIEVFALDGYPEAIFDPHPLTEKVQRLVASMKGRFPAGIQLDIEPYLLDGFSNDPHGFGKYLDAHAQVKRALAGQARLSIVMPFWLTSLPLGNRAVAFAAIDVADEVAIMSYRTDLEELRELADDHLRYADLVGVPVWLALETRPLPLEEHVRLQRVTRHRNPARMFPCRRRSHEMKSLRLPRQQRLPSNSIEPRISIATIFNADRRTMRCGRDLPECCPGRAGMRKPWPYMRTFSLATRWTLMSGSHWRESVPGNSDSMNP